ncbi:hypothetical protein P7K49_006638, partial [Saguinus oedipus]
MWDRIPSESPEHTARLWSLARAAGLRCAGGVSSCGRGSPTCSARLRGAAGPLPELWRGPPVAYPKDRLSAPHCWLLRARELRSFSAWSRSELRA